MIVNSIYNHNHFLAHTKLSIRAAYVVPAFILVLLGTAVVFNLLVIVFYILLTRVITKISLGEYVRLLMVPFLFIATGCLTIALTFHSATPFLNIGGFSLGIDEDNIAGVLLLFSRSLSTISIVYFYLLSHTISEIAEAMHCCKIPRLFIELFVLSYKFIINLISAGRYMHIAQNCRLAYSHKGNNFSAFSMLISAIFKKAMLQTTHLEIALTARLSMGDFNFISPRRSFRKKQVLAPLLIALFLVLMYLMLEYYV